MVKVVTNSSTNNDGNRDFIFSTKLSFVHLIEFWTRELESESPARRAIARQVFEYIPEDHPLRAVEVSVDDSHVYAELIDLLMTAVIPTSARNTQLSAAFVPFSISPIFATEPFLKLRMLDQDNGSYSESIRSSMREQIERQKALAAYHVILHEIYGASNTVETSYAVRSIDPETGLDRYLRVVMDTQFIRIAVLGDKPDLTEDQIQQLLDNPNDLELLQSAIPADRFEFQGFSIMRAVDVTRSEVISKIKQDLLAKDALVCPDSLDKLERRVRSLISNPDARLGVIGLDRCDTGEVSGARKIGRSLLLEDGMPMCHNPKETLYHKVFFERTSVLVNELGKIESPTEFQKALLDKNIDSLFLAPLMSREMPIGIIEIGSPQGKPISPNLDSLLNEVSSLFSTALKRSIEEQEDRVQAWIKRKFTAIHPVVEWKFRRVALENITDGSATKAENIKFKAVHSLYGTSDVRGSSVHRGAAIQQDLAEQLGLALAVVIAASTVRPRPSLDELGYRLSNNIEKVLSRVHSGDELTFTNFLRTEVEPLFGEFKKYSPDVAKQVDRYFEALDSELGVLYNKRRDFDESIAIINDTIGQYVNHRQEEAQAMVPHYFEMYRTDGVEYNMYAGESLLSNSEFNELDLKNLRLWQLITMAGVAMQTKRLAPSLPVTLETAQLVLIQSAPVDIHFRVDEKKFDVAGAYNIRYEIVKKRIDKATVKGTDERLTQPGTLALVYSHEEEEVEYRRYLDYLFAAGYFTGEIEIFDLSDLPGVTGLKAMRVTVADDQPGLSTFPIPDPASQRTDKELDSDSETVEA